MGTGKQKYKTLHSCLVLKIYVPINYRNVDDHSWFVLKIHAHIGTENQFANTWPTHPYTRLTH